MNLIANGILFLNKAKEILPYQDLTSITPNQKEKLNKMIEELENLENKIVESSDELTKVQQAFAKKFRYELDN
jgi:thiaminase